LRIPARQSTYNKLINSLEIHLDPFLVVDAGRIEGSQNRRDDTSRRRPVLGINTGIRFLVSVHPFSILTFVHHHLHSFRAVRRRRHSFIPTFSILSVDRILHSFLQKSSAHSTIDKMKTATALALAASMANMAAAHATFQQLWVNGKDLESTCVRMPASNSPVEDPTSNNMRCNANAAAASTTCGVKAGDVVTVEMHQHNDRDCTKEAIGGAHHGPVMMYLGAVEDAAAADGSGEFFKVFEAGYFAENKTWANDLINEGCGKQSFTIPSDIAPGDYLLRAETVALHAAGSANGAQYYMSCYALRIEGTGSAKPAGVKFPGAYKATDPGLLINSEYPCNRT
jgi:cellulase